MIPWLISSHCFLLISKGERLGKEILGKGTEGDIKDQKKTLGRNG